MMGLLCALQQTNKVVGCLARIGETGDVAHVLYDRGDVNVT